MGGARAVGLATAALGLVLAAPSCGGGKRQKSTASKGATVEKGAVDADSSRFPHDVHTGNNERIRTYKNRGLLCTDCHPQEAVVKGDYARPGLNDHSPCDECHADEFYKPPGEFCKNCHTEIDPKIKGATKMQPYPERGFVRVLASEFSHRQHLDVAKMDEAVGFHVSCNDCHLRDEKTKDPLLPTHKECARCHASKDVARQALNMGECKNCHPQRNIDLVRGRIFIKQDLIFAHGDHVEDRGGAPIACDTCHADIPRSRSVSDVSVPKMQRCATCHQDSQKTPDRVRIAKCDVCHEAIDTGLPPANHLVGKELPENHTVEFRTNHGEQAASKDSNCKFCHDGLTDSPRESCYQCHQIMRPRDHNLGWREDSHGREAASDRERCAGCHNADYCTACHAIPPRSHQPFAEFRLGAHAQQASFDLRSCFACHTFETSCAACHRRLR